MPGSVGIEVDDEGIAVVTISQPRRRNAMTYPMMAELFDAFARADADPACRVVILTGDAGTFCSGTDLTFLADIPPEDSAASAVACTTTTAGGTSLPSGSPSSPPSTVTPWAWAPSGPACATCASRPHGPASRGTSCTGGLVPDTGAGTWLLPRLVGVQTAMKLLMSGDFWSAQEAFEAGYVDALVEPDQLMDAAREQARSFLRGLPEAQARTKRLLYDGLARGPLDHQPASRAQLLACFASDEHARGLADFVDRAP